MDNGGSVPPGNNSQTQRSTIDQDVERAFDLLRHYQGFLCKPSGSLTDEQTTRAIDQLEGVMRKWLPRAGAAQDRLLDDVCAAIGDREKAARLLANVQLTPALNECMVKVALLAVPANQTAQRATATCRREIQHWRTLLPPVRRGPDQLRHVDPDDRFASRAVGMYWSADLTSRPSRLGASLFLAAACDAVAAAARKQGMPVDSLRPALRLAQRLRDNPEWTHVDAREVVQVIDEQVALAREVQDLLAEIDLGSVKPSSTGDYGAVGEARRRLHDAVTSISGCLSDIRTLIGRYPSASHALILLDHHVQFPGADPEPDHPDRTPTWRAVIQAIRTHIATARELWEASIGGIDGYLRVELARTSRGSVRCGPFERNTHHELVIAIARLIVDPLDEGAIWQNELGSLGVEILDADTVPRVARLRVIEDMGTRPWWQAVALDLEREYAQAIHHIAVAPPPTKAGVAIDAAATGVTGIPERVLKFPRAPDAKQKCLEALARAHAGIPTHQDIADAVGLELQTVKEAMPLLKKAGFVEKVEGSWTITDKGREHLRLRRGE